MANREWIKRIQQADRVWPYDVDWLCRYALSLLDVKDAISYARRTCSTDIGGRTHVPAKEWLALIASIAAIERDFPEPMGLII